jgi:hypothetical protein
MKWTNEEYYERKVFLEKKIEGAVSNSKVY